jgi:hypothetical protein
MTNTLSVKFIQNLKPILDEYVEKFNRPDFIADDPISIPHRFSKPQDIEITAFWTAILAWGQRKTIINSANRLFEYMDNAPFDFIKNHQEVDRKRFENFKHRTFQPIDALYFLEFLQQFYQKNDSLETAFARHLNDFGHETSDFGNIPTPQIAHETSNVGRVPKSDLQNPKSKDPSVSTALIGFHNDFFDLPDVPHRTRKHVATPLSKST